MAIAVRRYGVDAEGHTIELVDLCESAEEFEYVDGALLLGRATKKGGNATIMEIYAPGEWINAKHEEPTP